MKKLSVWPMDLCILLVWIAVNTSNTVIISVKCGHSSDPPDMHSEREVTGCPCYKLIHVRKVTITIVWNAQSLVLTGWTLVEILRRLGRTCCLRLRGRRWKLKASDRLLRNICKFVPDYAYMAPHSRRPLWLILTLQLHNIGHTD
jgi:hypothetical protein